MEVLVFLLVKAAKVAAARGSGRQKINGIWITSGARMTALCCSDIGSEDEIYNGISLMVKVSAITFEDRSGIRGLSVEVV